MVGATVDPKDSVRQFWQDSSCGEVYARGEDLVARCESHRQVRYALEPYILTFAGFDGAAGKDVLEVGVGMGADHVEWARHAPRSLTGVDLTTRAIEWTAECLEVNGLSSSLAVADAENLPFKEDSFDLIYTWGVLHHTPDTQAAISEVRRVLRPGGEARLMIYHARSIVGYLLWLRYALLAGHPRRSLGEIYAAHLESPGTKAFTVAEAEAMMAGFHEVTISTQLSFGDLLEGQVGQRHDSWLLRAAKGLWPRRLIRRVLAGHGLMLLITARK